MLLVKWCQRKTSRPVMTAFFLSLSSTLIMRLVSAALCRGCCPPPSSNRIYAMASVYHLNTQRIPPTLCKPSSSQLSNPLVWQVSAASVNASISMPRRDTFSSIQSSLILTLAASATPCSWPVIVVVLFSYSLYHSFTSTPDRGSGLEQLPFWSTFRPDARAVFH